MTPFDEGASAPVHQDRLWLDNGWTARVIKNEDDDGWAVEMIKDGEPEPALVGPWTMGRDKKNPKPLDSAAFNTLVKTAAEVHPPARAAACMRCTTEVTVTAGGERVTVTLDIVADEDDPHAELARPMRRGEELARVRVGAGFRLSAASASAWIESGVHELTSAVSRSHSRSRARAGGTRAPCACTGRRRPCRARAPSGGRARARRSSSGTAPAPA